MFTIKQGIPVPVAKTKLPIFDMKVGDCMIFDRDINARARNNVRVNFYLYGKRHNQKFRTKIIDGQLHIWRIA